MAETPADQTPARTQPEIRPESGNQFWCYHCDKRVAIDTIADDVVCCECKNGFVESISAAAVPAAAAAAAAAADPLDDSNFGSQFIQVLRLIAQAAREEDALPTLPADPSNDDYLQIELDEWDNDDDEEEEEEDEDEEHSEEAENRERGAENRERGAENNRSDGDDVQERLGIEVNEDEEEEMRQYRRAVLQLSLSGAASRRMIFERGLDWAVGDDDDEEEEEEEEDDDDEHSVEVVREEGAENRERGTEDNRSDGDGDGDEEEGIEVAEPRREDDEEEMRRRHRRDVLRLSLRDFASRAASRRNRILDWADVLMGLENHSIELTLQVPDSDTYVGNPGDYVDASEYEALLQNLAESDSGGRRGAPPAAKAAVEGLESVEIDKEENTIVCSICKDSVNVGEIAKNLPCGHGYHGECIVPWLGSRNSCPVCRFELPTDDQEYEEERKKRVVVAGLRAASSSSSSSPYAAAAGDSPGSALE